MDNCIVDGLMTSEANLLIDAWQVSGKTTEVKLILTTKYKVGILQMMFLHSNGTCI